jgi:hypothetical protein
MSLAESLGAIRCWGAVYDGTIPRLIDTVVVPRAGDGVALALFRSDRAGPHSLVADNENDLPGYG